MIHRGVPRQDDGKEVVTQSPATEGTFTWFSSKGDNLGAGTRGGGTKLKMTFTGSGSNSVDIQYIEPVEIHKGCAYWSPVNSANWGFDDEWRVSLILSATAITENGTNTGNCNRVEIIPESGLYIVVPAADDGAYDVNLTNACPTPDGYTKKTPDNVGYWNVDKYWSETITPNYNGVGEFNLYTFANEMFFCHDMDCGNPEGTWHMIPDKAEWVSKKWKVRFYCNKTTDSSGTIGGYLKIFRPGAT
jgi:hypothetical protein